LAVVHKRGCFDSTSPGTNIFRFRRLAGTGIAGDLALGESSEQDDVEPFNEKEMDKIIRQILDKVRGNYFENGEGARGIPGEVKKIIENSIERV
jgi:hypothetical protein